jgi:hypothetical protein
VVARGRNDLSAPSAASELALIATACLLLLLLLVVVVVGGASNGCLALLLLLLLLTSMAMPSVPDLSCGRQELRGRRKKQRFCSTVTILPTAGSRTEMLWKASCCHTDRPSSISHLPGNANAYRQL